MNFIRGSFRGTLRRNRTTFQPVTAISSARISSVEFHQPPPKACAESSFVANTATLPSLCHPTAIGAPNAELQTLPALSAKNSSQFPSSSTPRQRESSQSGRDARHRAKRKAIGRRVHSASTVEVPPEMASLISRLHSEGFLKDNSFLDEGKYNTSRISAQEYSQGFLNALVKFGKDKQEIAKSLSGYHLKKIALLGCPSSEKLTIFAAKSLRSFFSIQEDTVCKGCKIKSLCQFANKKLGGKQNLALRDVLLAVVGYIMPSPNHVLRKHLSSEIQLSVSKVLKEINNLSV